jgi:hypothetical protein
MRVSALMERYRIVGVLVVCSLGLVYAVGAPSVGLAKPVGTGALEICKTIDGGKITRPSANSVRCCGTPPLGSGNPSGGTYCVTCTWEMGQEATCEEHPPKASPVTPGAVAPLTPSNVPPPPSRK